MGMLKRTERYANAMYVLREASDRYRSDNDNCSWDIRVLRELDVDLLMTRNQGAQTFIFEDPKCKYTRRGKSSSARPHDISKLNSDRSRCTIMPPKDGSQATSLAGSDVNDTSERNKIEHNCSDIDSLALLFRANSPNKRRAWSVSVCPHSPSPLGVTI